MAAIDVRIKRLDDTVELPSYAYTGDAGLDLRANESVDIRPYERVLLSPGWLAPAGRTRSGGQGDLTPVKPGELVDTVGMEVVADVPCDVYQNKEAIVGYSCRTNIGGRNVFWPMTMKSLLPRADGNQLYQLHLAFEENPGEVVTSGMNIEVGIESLVDSAASGFWSIPLCSVFRDEGKTCVWVLNEDSTVQRRPVTLGASVSGDSVSVLSGLEGQEQIVRSGVRMLQEGERVKVLEKPAETNVGGML